MSSKGNLSEGLRVNVTLEEREALEEIAKREDRSVAAVMRRAIRELLKRDREEAVA